MSNLQDKIATLESQLAEVKKLAAECDNKKYRELSLPEDENYILKPGDQFLSSCGKWYDLIHFLGKSYEQYCRAFSGDKGRVRILIPESKFKVGDWVVYEPKNPTNFYNPALIKPTKGSIYKVIRTDGHIYYQPIINVELAPNNHFSTFETEFRLATQREINWLQPYKTGNFELGDYVVHKDIGGTYFLGVLKIQGGQNHGGAQYPYTYLMFHGNVNKNYDATKYRFATNCELFNHFVLEAEKKGIKVGNKVSYKGNAEDFVIERFCLNTDLLEKEKSGAVRQYNENVFLVATKDSSPAQSAPVDICTLCEEIKIYGRVVEFCDQFIRIGCQTILNKTIRDLVEIASKVQDFYIMIDAEKVDAKKLKEINARLKY